ncbi:hypothetical protein [Thioalkalivibrio sp. ALJT]|uniref:hypothetical protein n=1 Tax=Thioalkalivibrio sp. ALJT TaxID=1158146 RepID=UPI00036CC500|nr:hypothetical protein [Thioalkalivibrio sp. ALJT]
MATDTLIRRAAEHFQRQDYQQALDLYREAATLLGEGQVRANIQLCERRLDTAASMRPVEEASRPAVPTVEEQLEQTQARLEYYYQRYQELKWETAGLENGRQKW